MIDVKNLSKQFHVYKKEPGLWGSVKSLFHRDYITKNAVKGVSFRVDEGEIVGLIGANGAGKTTLIKMLAGIIYPSGGEATVLGHTPWQRDNRFRSQIALIMGQKAQLWWDLPAADCFLLLREIYRLDGPDYDERLEYLTELFQVREQLNIQIRKLSLGERMKMELMAALLHAPRVVYLDEPTIGLDVTMQRAIREFLLRYREKHRPAMILTSHYMEDIQHLCERIIIIREGEFIYDGKLKDVVQAYAKHKVITAHLTPRAEGAATADLSKFGEVVARDRDSIKIHVPRAEVAAAASGLLAALPLRDLSIEEVDIGTIVANIFAERGDVDGGATA